MRNLRSRSSSRPSRDSTHFVLSGDPSAALRRLQETRDKLPFPLARDLLIGNGSLVIGFDAAYRLADVYFPHVGLENHAGERFRFGVSADGEFSWVASDEWQRTLTYLRETNVTDVSCVNETLGIRLRCYDAVDSEANVYVRKIVVRNLRSEPRKVKLF